MSDRTLEPLDLEAIRTRVREDLLANPNPFEIEQARIDRAVLVAEVSRLLRQAHQPQQASDPPKRVQSNGQSISGEACTCCGGLNLVWAGACKVCLDCGTSGGCG